MGVHLLNGRMQETYKTRKEAEARQRFHASTVKKTYIRRNKRKGPDTYTLVIWF